MSDLVMVLKSIVVLATILFLGIAVIVLLGVPMQEPDTTPCEWQVVYSMQGWENDVVGTYSTPTKNKKHIADEIIKRNEKSPFTITKNGKDYVTVKQGSIVAVTVL